VKKLLFVNEKTRNSKHETRNKIEIRMFETLLFTPPVLDIRISVIRICFGFRISNFGFPA